MKVSEICNRQVPTVPAATTVRAAAKSMQAFDEHFLVVTDEPRGKRVAIGIVTDREIASVVAREGDPARLSLKEIMGSPPGFLAESDDALEALSWMRRQGLPHAVVHDQSGAVLGLITTALLVECLAAEIAEVMPSGAAESAAHSRNAMN